MRKLTKDQKHYRKLKKDSKKDFRYTDKPEEGKYFRGVSVTRKPVSVRVKQDAYDKLEKLGEKLKMDKWEVLSHILVYKLPRYAGLDSSRSAIKRYLWEDPVPAEKTKYKGSTGVKQLTYWVTSTAWRKLDIHKRTVGKSKARIVQELIMDYKPCTQATLLRAKNQRAKYKEVNDFYKARRQASDLKAVPKERRSTNKLYINSNLEIVHKLGFPIEKWFDDEWDQYHVLMPIADRLMKERAENWKSRSKLTQEKEQEYWEKTEQLAEEQAKEREEIDLWEAE